MSKTKDREQFDKARQVIPWGTQTNAKRPVEEFEGAMPFFIEKAKGCRIWDIDGRELIDYRSALGPIILGYCYDAVDQAVKAQIDQGVLFSMASPLELELATQMLKMLPGIGGVRFLKTGGEACAAAVRIARAYTRKYKLISIGYHGWNDMFIAAKKDVGIPPVLQEYVFDVPFGDLNPVADLLKQHQDEICCVITEPFQWKAKPDFEYIQGLRKLCDANDVLLIFDEVLTGFRMAKGGAAEYFGVIPDLAVYAKALANGYPLSAFAGTQEVLRAMDETFITATHAGDTLSIMAALATLRVMESEPVHAHLNAVGQQLFDGINQLCRQYRLPMEVDGIPSGFAFVTGQVLTEADQALIKKIDREIFAQDIFAYKLWYLNYSHTRRDIDLTLERLEIAIKKAVKSNCEC